MAVVMTGATIASASMSTTGSPSAKLGSTNARAPRRCARISADERMPAR